MDSRARESLLDVRVAVLESIEGSGGARGGGGGGDVALRGAIRELKAAARKQSYTLGSHGCACVRIVRALLTTSVGFYSRVVRMALSSSFGGSSRRFRQLISVYRQGECRVSVPSSA